MSTSLVDADGTTRFRGTIVGGGSATPPVETYAGTLVTTAASAQLTFAHAAGATLLDYADTTAPEFLTGGTYAVTLYVTPDNQYAGKVATVALQLPVLSLAQAAPLDNVSGQGGLVVISVVLPFAAGDAIGAAIYHDVGGPAGFQAQGYIARLF